MKFRIQKSMSSLVFLVVASLACSSLSTPPTSTPITTSTSIISDIVQFVSLNDFFGGNLTYNYPIYVQIPADFASVGNSNGDLVTWLSDTEAKEYATSGQMPEMGNFFLASVATNTSYDKNTDTFLNLPNNDSETPSFESSTG